MFETMTRTRAGELSPAIANATSRAAEATLLAMELKLRLVAAVPMTDWYSTVRNGKPQ